MSVSAALSSNDTDAPTSKPGRAAVRRSLIPLASATAALAAICTFGLLDRSIRSDPFTDSPAWWQRFSKPQPDPRLALIPVLPMGRAGVLSWRPKSTRWIADKSFFPPSSATGPSAAEAFGLGIAHAEDFPPKFNKKPDGLPREFDKARPPNIIPLPSQLDPPTIPPQAQQSAVPPTPRPPTITLVPSPDREPK